MQEQSFFLWKRTDEIKYDQNEKKKDIKLAGWSFEKTQDSIIFPDLISIYQTFSRSGKCWANSFQDFFKNSRLYTNPVPRMKSRTSDRHSYYTE